MNKKLLRFVISVIIILNITISNTTFAFANEAKDSIGYIYAIAENAPSSFPTTSNWINNKVINTTALYDIDDLLYAYCIDIKNKDTDRNGYMIISALSDMPQILEFHPNTSSLYMENKEKKAYYNGVTQYYIKENDTMLRNISNDKLTKKSNVKNNINTNLQNKQYSINAVGGFNNLTGVPDYPYQIGCTPTSVGMQIKYIYGSSVDSQTTLINQLANKMNSIGNSTLPYNVRQGVVNYLATKNITPAFCGFMSTEMWGDPKYGQAYNSLGAYQSFIDSNVPVAIMMKYANGTSPDYPNGFGDHTVCGTGYYVGSSGEFVIIHTTSQEGDIYVAYSEYALGQFAWFAVYGDTN